MADDVIIRDVPSRSAGLRDRFNLEKVSWGAIWAGTMVTLGMEALFLSFGIFINALIGGSNGWAAIWYLVTAAVSFYCGSWCAARLSDMSDRGISILHGLTTWGLATMSTLVIAGVTTAAIGLAWLTRPYTQATGPVWGGNTILYGGIIWGGVVLSLIASYFGGAAGMPVPQSATGIDQPEATPSPMRRVS
jgi:hypothetical protein